MPKSHSIANNLTFGELKNLRGHLLHLVDPVILGKTTSIYFPDYRTERDLEQKGIDFQIVTDFKTYKFQGKLRRSEWWLKRGIDFFIEDKNSIRKNGEGWFYRYRNNGIDYFILGWKSPQNGFFYLELYKNFNDIFFKTIDSILEKESLFRPPPHKQHDKNYNDLGETSGFILPLVKIKKLLVSYSSFLSDD